MNINYKKGFTLIELLIVIAVLGTLAVVVLIALNPVQQLARTRDAGRSSTVQQLGHAMESRGTILGGQYPDETGGANWIRDLLVDSGEIQTVPGVIQYNVSGTSGPTCGSGDLQNAMCYVVGGANDNFIIYTKAEAESNISQCATGEDAFFIYRSLDGRGGIVCETTGSEPNVTASGDFVN